jgi:DnaJ-class molecular chaperone
MIEPITISIENFGEGTQIILEEKCQTCNGTGKGLQSFSCTNCYGHGFVPNENGKKLISFMSANGYRRAGGF